MIKKIEFAFLALATILMVACKDDSNHAGSSLMNSGDSVWVCVDTLGMKSMLVACSPIISDPDSLLLGEMENGYGTTRAEILTQLACPVGYKYPENAVMDSVCLFLYYQSYSGDGNSPLQLDVQEMDRSTLKYSETYYSNIDTSLFVSPDAPHILARKHILVPAHPKDELSSSGATFSSLCMRVDADWAKHFFEDVRDFSSQDAFNEKMKGLYIYTDFGGSAIINVNTLALCVYYHFSYNKAGRDTTVTDMKSFYANSEVRQVNRVRYLDNDYNPGAEEDLVLMLQNPDSDFIVSPGGVYTCVSIPLREITRKIYRNLSYEDASGMLCHKRVYVNKAEMLVRVRNYFTGSSLDRTRDHWAQPANNVLLIRDHAVNSFFKEKQMPMDTLAILGTLSATEDENGKPMYYYSYDLSSLLTVQLRDSAYVPDTLRMIMVPVSVESNVSSSGSSTPTSVKQSQELSTTIINSAQRGDHPLVMEVVYSGF